LNHDVIRLGGETYILTAGNRNAKHCATARGVEPAEGVIMKKNKFYASGMLAAALTFVLVLAVSCTGNVIDGLLDEYDKLCDSVIEYFQKAKQLSDSSDDSDGVKTLAKFAAVQKEMEKYRKKLEVITTKLGKYEDDMTAEQTERFMRITFKLANIADSF
jgi:hypothetical protein